MGIDLPALHAASGVVTERGFKPCGHLLPALPARALDRIETSQQAAYYGALDLRAIEGPNGHTLRRHVGVDDGALEARAARLHHDASAFSDVRTAQRIVDEAFSENQRRIGSWLAQRTHRNLQLHVHTDRPLGRVFRYDLGRIEATTDADVILERARAMPQGYTVITAYPSSLGTKAL